MVFGCGFGTSISYQLLLCFAQLQNQWINTFQPMFLRISGSYLSPHDFLYLFLIPTDTELELLLSDMPARGAWTVEQWFIKKSTSPKLILKGTLWWSDKN